MLWILVFAWLNNAEARGEAGISSLVSQLLEGIFRVCTGCEKPTPGKEQPHAPVQAWGRPAGEQVCREGPGRPGGRQVDHELAACPGCQESQWDPGVH